MIGNSIVFRTWNGKIFMYNRPSKPKKQSVAQKKQNKFSRAVAFSKKMRAIPEKKAVYTEIAKKKIFLMPIPVGDPMYEKTRNTRS